MELLVYYKKIIHNNTLFERIATLIHKITDFVHRAVGANSKPYGSREWSKMKFGALY